MRILLLTVLLFGSGVCSAKKMQMAIESVILNADLIVVGAVERDGSGSYVFRIDETWHGDNSLRTIRVNKWKEWTCDRRGFTLGQGQRLVLLLNKEGERYSPVNGSTGEIPIQADSIPAHNGYYDVLPHAVPVREFGAAVRALRGCCHITAVNNDFGYFYEWAWDCTPEERSERKASSAFAAWLFARMEAREERR
jgi:hypothetical protein